MKVRSYFSTKKQRKPNKSTSLPQGQMSGGQDVPNGEELACSTLMEESWINNHQKYLGEEIEQPDAFLRITPRPQEMPQQSDKKQMGKLKTEENRAKIKQVINKISNSRSRFSPQKQKQQDLFRENLLTKINKTSDSMRNPISESFLMGKEVLCLTQYIIAQPHCALYDLDYSRRTHRNKYLRVLKQMKNRHKKNKTQKSYKNIDSPTKYSESGSMKNHNRIYFSSQNGFQRLKQLTQLRLKQPSKLKKSKLSRLNLRSEHIQRQLGYNRNNSYSLNASPQRSVGVGISMKDKYKSLSKSNRFS